MWQSDALAYCNAMREIAESQQVQALVDAAPWKILDKVGQPTSEWSVWHHR